MCGKTFERRQSNGGEFCTRSCALEWRWNHSLDSDKHKQRASQRNKETSPKPPRETLYRLHVDERMTAPQIAELYSVQPQTVRKWLHLDGIQLIPAEPHRPERKAIPLPQRPAATKRQQGESKTKEPRAGGNFAYQPPTRYALAEMYEGERLSTTQIGERFGVSSTTVAKWLTQYGIVIRPAGIGLAARGIEPPTCEELTRMIHADRLTYAQIAAQYGVDQSAVMHWLNRHGIDRPPTWFEQHNTPETVAAIRVAYESGASLDAIGQYYGGVTRTMVVRLLKLHGVPLRADGWDGGKRFACQDGHLVRSTYERRIDDWLNEHGVEHTYEPSLPFSPIHKADFLANGWYIEVWGVTHNEAYQERKQRKLELYAANNAPLIEVPYYAFAKAQRDLWIRRLQQCLTRPT